MADNLLHSSESIQNLPCMSILYSLIQLISWNLLQTLPLWELKIGLREGRCLKNWNSGRIAVKLRFEESETTNDCPMKMQDSFDLKNQLAVYYLSFLFLNVKIYINLEIFVCIAIKQLMYHPANWNKIFSSYSLRSFSDRENLGFNFDTFLRPLLVTSVR